MQYYKVPAPLLKGIYDYLSARPHKEVRLGIEALEKLEMLEEENQGAAEEPTPDLVADRPTPDLRADRPASGLGPRLHGVEER